jgi:hypothetical protein
MMVWVAPGWRPPPRRCQSRGSATRSILMARASKSIVRVYVLFFQTGHGPPLVRLTVAYSAADPILEGFHGVG